MRFPPKVVIVYSQEKEGFNCINNHKYNKSANFQLYNISKINDRTL